MNKIQGWFKENDGRFYLSLVKPIKNGIIVEVGCWKGRSISYIGRNCMKNNTTLYCVDSWLGSTDKFNQYYQKLLSSQNVQAIFKENMAKLGIKVKCLRRDSLSAASLFEDNSIDLVFLDGSHDYLAVKKDLNAWFKKVKDEGILAGHDYLKKHDGLISAVNEFITKHQLKLLKGGGSIWYFYKNKSDN